jgi:hypothetical protein
MSTGTNKGRMRDWRLVSESKIIKDSVHFGHTIQYTYRRRSCVRMGAGFSSWYTLEIGHHHLSFGTHLDAAWRDGIHIILLKANQRTPPPGRKRLTNFNASASSWRGLADPGHRVRKDLVQLLPMDVFLAASSTSVGVTIAMLAVALAADPSLPGARSDLQGWLGRSKTNDEISSFQLAPH